MRVVYMLKNCDCQPDVAREEGDRLGRNLDLGKRLP